MGEFWDSANLCIIPNPGFSCSLIVYVSALIPRVGRQERQIQTSSYSIFVSWRFYFHLVSHNPTSIPVTLKTTTRKNEKPGFGQWMIITRKWVPRNWVYTLFWNELQLARSRPKWGMSTRGTICKVCIRNIGPFGEQKGISGWSEIEWGNCSFWETQSRLHFESAFPAICNFWCLAESSLGIGISRELSELRSIAVTEGF